MKKHGTCEFWRLGDLQPIPRFVDIGAIKDAFMEFEECCEGFPPNKMFTWRCLVVKLDRTGTLCHACLIWFCIMFVGSVFCSLMGSMKMESLLCCPGGPDLALHFMNCLYKSYGYMSIWYMLLNISDYGVPTCYGMPYDELRNRSLIAVRVDYRLMSAQGTHWCTSFFVVYPCHVQICKRFGSEATETRWLFEYLQLGTVLWPW